MFKSTTQQFLCLLLFLINFYKIIIFIDKYQSRTAIATQLVSDQVMSPMFKL